MANQIFENIWKIMKENKFQLINEISNKLLCNICNKLMVKAYGKDKFCPGKDEFCQLKMINFEKDVIINYPLNIRIAGIVVKCPNKYCEFTDELSLIENHMRTCDKNPTSCPYFEIGCKNNEVVNDEMKDHLSTEIHCHTNLLLDFINNLRNEMESMKNDIVELKLENKNLKKELNKIKIKYKSNQMKNEEFEKIIKNNLLEIEELNKEMVVIKNENRSMMNKLENIEKSRVMLERNEVIERMQRKSEQQTREIEEMKEKCEQTENKEIEMRRIIDEIFATNADLIKKSDNCDEKINNYDEKINNYDEKINNYDEKINNYDKKINNYDEKINNYNEKINNYDDKINNYNDKINNYDEKINNYNEKINNYDEKINNYDEKINNYDEKINNYDEKINNLLIKIIEIERTKEKVNLGEFEWKIENLSQQQREINIYSEPFYSHKNGYKMCLSVWIEGDYYVNAYFYLMKGEFDYDLLWPFKHAITIDIINQTNGRVDTSKTIKYNDYPNNKGWNKPTTERNSPIVFHIIIKSKEIIRNNQMLIKCKIKI